MAVPLAIIGILVMVSASLGRQIRHLKGQLIEHQLTLDELTTKNQQLMTRLQRVEGEREAVDANVATLREGLASTARALEEARDELETLRWRFERVNEAKENLATRVLKLSQEQEQRQQLVAQLEREKGALQQTLGRLRERLVFVDRDYQEMVHKFADLQRQRAAGYDAGSSPRDERQVASAAGPLEPAAWGRTGARSSGSTVELPPIIVQKDRADIATPVRAHLVEVNEPYRFVVVDKGSADGVRVGMTFDIVRGGGTVVGQATVVRVRPRLAACDVVRTQSSAALEVGDLAVQRAP
jgi:predicted nuclease with TOPRIM domain